MRRLPCPLALVALLAALTGCATLAGRRQYVSVDSSPRGLEVTDAADPHTVLGRTPFFVSLPRASAHAFRLRLPSGTDFTTPVACDYRWRGALLGNVPLGVLGLVGSPLAGALLYGAGNGVDVLSGAAWDCPARLRFAAEWAEKPAENKVDSTCSVLVAAPPKSDDEKLSRLLVTRWKERRSRLGDCAQAADDEAAERLYQRWNVTHDDGFDPLTTAPERLNELGFRSRATHVVVLRATAAGDRLKVEPTRYDLHSLEATTEPSFELDAAAEDLPRDSAVATIASYLRLLPNSVAFSAARKDFLFTARDGAKLLADSPTASVLPSVLSNWTVAWVDHPEQHGAWDATFGFSPSLGLSYNARRLALAGPDGVERTLDAAVVHAFLLYEAILGFHTPLGALSAALGLGGGGAWLWEDGRYHSATARTYASLELSYTAFVTERLFLQLSLASTATNRENVLGDGFAMSAWTQEAVTLGWWLPELRSVARRLF